ncbi:MAG TPA: RNA polymerase sigma factor [Bacteroidales bacterium]|jgi:RNA polymerase sigma-70 factor (ECF subfamily)|nr:RNA polymerase sigma factor [Bacteroidales bacterium]HNZ42363.1 RNA polymerase sigma factor [Bacteroidales bacterium]HOH83442.1 RNA polymerase sigma factor [Bacteroidales bacterium]HPB25028.1 RNA polymerase sigma factor [Bacteroidales bacterium]HPI31644.1 RNA polymerase sigma factor [Bacteroidales bacterium]
MSLDRNIIEGCIAGNRKAQKFLFEKYKAAMMGVCLRYCKSKDEAEDVLMEAFMTVLSQIQSYRGDGSIDQWIRRIVVNTSINNYRKNLKHYFHADIENIAETEIEEDNTFDITDNHSVEEIMNAMQQMPQGYKIVLNLYVVEGYKHKEIAEMLNITVGTSKSQLSKARKIIQDKLTNK